MTYSIISFKHTIHLTATLSVIHALHCLGFLYMLLVCALRNKTYFRKCKVTKRGIPSFDRFVFQNIRGGTKDESCLKRVHGP